MKFLLPCPCGKKITIDKSDAGRLVTCECGKSVEAPGLRGIGDLQVAEEDEKKPVRNERFNWTPAHGLIFVMGALVFLCSTAVAGYYFYWSRQVITEKPLSLINEVVIKQSLEETTYEGSLSAWDGLVESGLGPYIEPGYVLARRFRREWTWWAMVAGGVALLGLLTSISTIVAARRSG
ncbi:MAG: hypothetical protein ACI9G1_006074 [Pirellulaceae bacterium]|jgi:hypothetical protein